MGFVGSVKTCLTTNYASFSGRASRAEFWWFQLFQLLYYIVFGTLAAVAFDTFASIGTLILIVFAIGNLALIIPIIAVHVRRLHDRNMSGWFYLLVIIPYVGVFVVWFICALPGNKGPNRFGEDPYAEANIGDVFS